MPESIRAIHMAVWLKADDGVWLEEDPGDRPYGPPGTAISMHADGDHHPSKQRSSPLETAKEAGDLQARDGYQLVVNRTGRRTWRPPLKYQYKVKYPEVLMK